MADEIVADLKRINDEMLAAYHELAAEHTRKLLLVKERIEQIEEEMRHDGT